MKNTLVCLHRMLIEILPWPQSLLLLFVRLIWGWGFIQAGYGKLTHLERTIQYFTDLNLPLPVVNAVLASSTELIGGALLLVGLFSRAISLPLIVTMIVAYLTAERDALASLFTSDNSAFFSAAPWPFLFASLIILLFGPGKLSLDSLLLKRLFPEEETAPHSQPQPTLS